ncbi:MAG: hypothetical protein KDK65_04490 [Chlamydiia bacterium]|nr:hypothetical protein [Chlamydiia bacterium]
MTRIDLLAQPHLEPLPVALAEDRESDEEEAFTAAPSSQLSPYALASAPTSDQLKQAVAKCESTLNRIAEEEENRDIQDFAHRQLDAFHSLLAEIFDALNEKKNSAEELSKISHSCIRKLHDFNRHLHDDRDKIVGELVKEQERHKVVGWVSAISSLTVLTALCVGVISSVFTGGVSGALMGVQMGALFVSGVSEGAQARIEWKMRQMMGELEVIKHRRQGNQSQTDATFAITRANNQAITDVIKCARDTIKNEQKLQRVILSMRGRS